MERISNLQLFTLTMLFQIGTTIIFGFASTAGRDAWLSVLLSTVAGAGLIYLYLKLMLLHPGLTLVEWYPHQFGPRLGIPIAWMYPLLFIYDAGRALADVKDLIPLTLLPLTPSWFTVGFFILVITYLLYCGLETMGRVGEIWLPIILLIIGIEIILILGSGVINYKNLLPIAGQGWERIWGSVWPLGITQSFGECIEFAMIWPYVTRQNRIIPVTLLATCITGLLLAFLDALAILVLGEATFTRNIYPLFVLVQQISVAEFLQNLDIIGIIYFLTTAFFKITLHIYCAVYAIRKLTHVPNGHVFILPVAVIVYYLSLTMASSVVNHIQTGLKILPYNLWIPLFLVFPGILFIVATIKKKATKKSSPIPSDT